MSAEFDIAIEYGGGGEALSTQTFFYSGNMSLDDATKRLQSTKQSLDDAYSPPGELDFSGRPLRFLCRQTN